MTMQGFLSSFRFLRAILLSTVLLAGGSLLAQDGILDVHGTVKNDATRKNLEGAKVEVSQNGKVYDNFTTTANGKYAFNLPLGYTYILKFSKDDFVFKKIEINTKGIPPEDMAGGFKLNMDMTLFASIEGFDLKIMEKPLGKAAFDSIRNSVEFDYDYTSRMQKEIADEMKRLQKMEKEIEKSLKEFNDLLAKGDQAMTAKKYAEAVSKFEAAVKLIPDRKPAPEKLAEAQAALDAENAAKELEQRYTTLMAQARGDIGKKKFAEARDALNEAKQLKPDEREPKDLLATIEKELKELEKRAQYDGIIALADKEFGAKNYAVSIKKYEEAIDLYPAENYPRDQIKAARKILDDQLAAAAADEERNKRYNDAMAAGERNIKDVKYEAAINKFREAEAIKPDEKPPKDKIKEVEALIAKAAKADQDAQANAQKAERDEFEKAYRDVLKRADDKFKAKKLSEAREDYVSAKGMKPEESYPQSRIDRIDELLGEQDAQQRREREATDATALAEAEYKSIIDAADAKFDAGDYQGALLDYQGAQLVKPKDKYPATRISRINEILSKQANDDADRLAEERRRKEEDRLAKEEADRVARDSRMQDQDADRRRRQEEEEAERARLAEERQRKADEERRRMSAFANNADATSEDEAERYYREARKRDEMAKRDKISEVKQNNSLLISNSEADAIALRDRREEDRNEVSDNMVRIYRTGEMNRESRVDEKERLKEKHADELVTYEQRADNRRDFAMGHVEQRHGQQSMIAEKDALRDYNIAEVQLRHEEVRDNAAAFASRGDARRTDNTFEVERRNQQLAEMAGDGEIIRQDRVAGVDDDKLRYSVYEVDVRRAADERRSYGAESVDEKKEQLTLVSAGKEDLSIDNMMAVRYVKERDSDLQNDRAAEQRNRSYDKRRELFNKDTGTEKSVDDYQLPPGYENLEEGVQEKSYEEGNKMIIERTVRRGNKVDTYRKVISKTGIYYFKNGSSITEGLWKRETLYVQN